MQQNSSIVPWERVGIPLGRPETAEDAVRLAHLDYQVEKKRLLAVVGRSRMDVEGHFATIRMDNGRCLGIVKNRYSVVQNSEAFSFLTPIANKELYIETGGVVDAGRKAWLLVRLPSEMRIGPSRDGMRKCLLVVNSHDGSTNIVVKPTVLRIVCSNAIPAVLRGSDPEIRIRHTAQAHDRLSEIRALLDQTKGTFEQIEYVFTRMSLKRVTNEQILDYVKKLIPDSADAESHARTENMRNQILRLHENGIGAKAFRGTVMGILNSVSEMTDHQATRDANKHLKSVLFGGAAEKLKNRALQLAESML
jgi:phage/plasmid-like protein (TIGR03299 family)